MHYPQRTSLVSQMLKRLPTVWRPGFDPWVRKIPWKRKWQPTPLLLPGKFHGQKEATVPGVIRSWTRLSDLTSLHFQSQCRYQDQEVQNEVTGAPHALLRGNKMSRAENREKEIIRKNYLESMATKQIWGPCAYPLNKN